MEKVLIYDPKKSEKVRKMKVVLIRLGVRVVNVTEDMLKMKIKDILGIAGDVKNFLKEPGINASTSEHDEFEDALKPLECKEEVLVMYGFQNQKIDQMLQGFKKSGVSKVALKAIVTQTNASWTMEQLIQELQKEHAFYQKVGENEFE